MPEIVVFLGPSLDREKALEILAADYRPPAARGDILDAASQGARIIVLIDGVFFQDCSVGHREILEAMKMGTIVIGASSMGALRAAELDTLGMEGVGEIYRMYRDGELVSDDEVALVFDPESFIPLSEPLINIRFTVRRAVEEGILGKEDAAILLEQAGSIYFPDRTYEQICEASREMIDLRALKNFMAFIRADKIDQKGIDTIAALQRAAVLAGEYGRSH
ncbi:MAG TPA: TfuA-related McrA-glycine thioamidation protein [Methanoregulaceae archaeon]|nr:TfuA-related McrA-glycine thioamidation protein [Methanoregulaceae archaeon]